MSSTLTPTPDQPRPELLLSLPDLRARLEEQRQFRVEQIASLAGADNRPYPVQIGADTSDIVPDSAHSEVSAALLAGARQALADIETALYRILNGQYGDCLRCGAPIGMPRLRTVPQTVLCADCHRISTQRPEAASDGESHAGSDASARPDANVHSEAGAARVAGSDSRPRRGQ
jgi:DnaK suppressor protein